MLPRKRSISGIYIQLVDDIIPDQWFRDKFGLILSTLAWDVSGMNNSESIISATAGSELILFSQSYLRRNALHFSETNDLEFALPPVRHSLLQGRYLARREETPTFNVCQYPSASR